MKKEIYSSHLFPYNDILTKEIESWYIYAEYLRKQDSELFGQMLNNCHKYAPAITAKGNDYSTISLFMTILLELHKNILINGIKKDDSITYNLFEDCNYYGNKDGE